MGSQASYCSRSLDILVYAGLAAKFGFDRKWPPHGNKARLIKSTALDMISQPKLKKCVSRETLSGLISIKHCVIGIAMVLTAYFAVALKPLKSYAGITMPQLEEMVPKQFGDWKASKSINQINPSPETQEKLNETYGAMITRTYENVEGEQVMLLATNEQGFYALHESFIKTLLGAMDKNDAKRFAGR